MNDCVTNVAPSWVFFSLPVYGLYPLQSAFSVFLNLIYVFFSLTPRPTLFRAYFIRLATVSLVDPASTKEDSRKGNIPSEVMTDDKNAMINIDQ